MKYGVEEDFEVRFEFRSIGLNVRVCYRNGAGVVFVLEEGCFVFYFGLKGYSVFGGFCFRFGFFFGVFVVVFKFIGVLV